MPANLRDDGRPPRFVEVYLHAMVVLIIFGKGVRDLLIASTQSSLCISDEPTSRHDGTYERFGDIAVSL